MQHKLLIYNNYYNRYMPPEERRQKLRIRSLPKNQANIAKLAVGGERS